LPCFGLGSLLTVALADLMRSLSLLVAGETAAGAAETIALRGRLDRDRLRRGAQDPARPGNTIRSM
jgi:hypothetical protein